MTLHFKFHLIGNISYLDISEAKLGLQKDYVWCLQLKDTGPHDLNCAFQFCVFVPY